MVRELEKAGKYAFFVYYSFTFCEKNNLPPLNALEIHTNFFKDRSK